MATSNCLLSPSIRQAQTFASENFLRQFASLVSCGFSVWCVLAKLSAKPYTKITSTLFTTLSHKLLGLQLKQHIKTR